MEAWREEHLYFQGDPFFAALFDDVNGAKKTIYLETYIFQHDSLGIRLARHLRKAAERGVAVKIIVDGFGSPLWNYFFQAELERAKIACKIFRRIPLDLFLLFPMIFPGFRKIFFRLERRDHRKLCVIDDQIGWVGSMNIASYHLKEFKGERAWRDTGVRVTGPAVEALTKAFEESWSMPTYFRRKTANSSRLVRAYSSRKMKRILYRDFLQKIRKAKSKIWLTTAYFVPTGSLVRALRSAAHRDVEICILTTAKTDIFLIRWIRAAFYFALLQSGAKIFEFQPTVLHAKTALIDDFAMVGSTNLNNRSFSHNLEIDIVLKKRESLQMLEKQFKLDLKKSQEVLKEDWKEAFWVDRLLAKIALLFKYWL